MYTFIGRDKELRTLQTAYESDRSELVVIYAAAVDRLVHGGGHDAVDRI
jgi:hypothetical protein